MLLPRYEITEMWNKVEVDYQPNSQIMTDSSVLPIN